MPFQFLEDLATADIAFRACGKDLEKLFQEAGNATLNAMIENIEEITPTEKRPFSLEKDGKHQLQAVTQGETLDPILTNK